LPEHVVGRSAERSLFADALSRPGPTVLFVHGSGGSGKSALLAAFASDARAAGMDVHASESGNLPQTSTRALILIDDSPDASTTAAELRRHWRASAAASDIVVVASRTALPANVRLAPDWPATVETITLAPLDAAAVEEYLQHRPIEVRQRIDRLSFGNPLALRLLDDMATTDPAQLPKETLDESMALVRQLLDGIVEPLPSAHHRRLVQLAAMVGHTTEDLVAAVLDGDSHQQFEWLRRQPYMTEADDGLVPDDLVRAIVDADFRWRDRLAYATLHRRASRHLINRIEAQAHGLETTLRGGVELFAMVRHRVSAPSGPAGSVTRTVYGEAELGTAPLAAVITEHLQQTGPLRETEQIAVTTVSEVAGLPPAVGTAAFEALHSATLAWDFVVVPSVDADLLALLDLHHVSTVEGGELFAHDWRRLAPTAWLAKILDQPWDAPVPPPTGTDQRILADEREFTLAVRSALRDLKSERRLATNPLIDSRTVQETLGGLAPEQRLRELIKNAAETLRTTEPALFRIIDLIYLRPTASQQTVAESMGLPFTTFRRWRNKAVALIAAQLWERELGIDER